MAFYKRRGGYYQKKRGPKKPVYKRKRNYGKKYSNAVSVPKKAELIADRYFAKLTFATSVNMSLSAGAPKIHVFRGNSMFDPDQSGAGAQPVGFDELSALYKSYRVIGSSIKATLLPPSEVVLQCGVCPILASGSPVADIDAMKGNAYGKYAVVCNRQPNQSTVTNYLSTEQALGLAKGTVKFDSDLGAVTTASPSTEWFWEVMCDYAFTGDTSSYTTSGVIEITYYCEFFGRQSFALS